MSVKKPASWRYMHFSLLVGTAWRATLYPYCRYSPTVSERLQIDSPLMGTKVDVKEVTRDWSLTLKKNVHYTNPHNTSCRNHIWAPRGENQPLTHIRQTSLTTMIVREVETERIIPLPRKGRRALFLSPSWLEEVGERPNSSHLILQVLQIFFLLVWGKGRNSTLH